MTAIETVRVELGERSYPVVIGAGLLAGAGARLAELLPTASRFAIVTDDHVESHHLPALRAGLADGGIGDERIVSITIRPGEREKRLQTVEQVADQLAAGRCDRGSVVLALGGGVVGDLAGFTAAMYMRGIAFVQLPTTLLAQVDASVGGKTAVDLTAGKNLVGAFHQPRLVLADVATLATLPRRELGAGLAEVVKAGIIGDPALVDLVEARAADALAAKDVELVIEIVRRAVAVKAGVVARDEREQGERAHLNLGHTLAHAIETSSGYGPILHGEAVALGMLAACRVGVRMGRTSPDLEPRLAGIFSALGLPIELEPWLGDDVLGHVEVDKKRAGRTVRYVIPEAPGRVSTAPITPAELAEYLRNPKS